MPHAQYTVLNVKTEVYTVRYAIYNSYSLRILLVTALRAACEALF